MLKNVLISVTEDEKQAIITCDLTKDHGKSKSGKCNICASTGGFVGVFVGEDREFSLSLNLVSKKR